MITAEDVRDEDAEPAREDRFRAEAAEIQHARAVAGPEEIRADGSGEPIQPELEDTPLDVGDHVEDREDFDATMVVVRTPLEKANEVDARNGETVAECNPDYPADDDVVVVKFPKRTSTDLGPLQGYAFPRSRLELVEPIHDRDDQEDDTDDEWIEDDNGDRVPRRSEPADFGGGESTGVQDL